MVEREAVLPGDTVDTSSESAERDGDYLIDRLILNSWSSSATSSSPEFAGVGMAVGRIRIDMENR